MYIVGKKKKKKQSWLFTWNLYRYASFQLSENITFQEQTIISPLKAKQ